MPYAPTVNDTSGQILAGYKTNAAEIRAAGNEALAQGIFDGVTNLAGGIAGAYTKAGENKMTSDYLDSMAGHFNNTMGADGQTPLMTDEMLEKFSKGSLGAKQGMIVPLMAQYEQNLKNSYLEQQMAGYLNRAYQTAANQAALRQPAPNQIPMGAGNPPPVNDTTTPSTPVFGAGIKTRRVY